MKIPAPDAVAGMAVAIAPDDRAPGVLPQRPFHAEAPRNRENGETIDRSSFDEVVLSAFLIHPKTRTDGTACTWTLGCC